MIKTGKSVQQATNPPDHSQKTLDAKKREHMENPAGMKAQHEAGLVNKGGITYSLYIQGREA